MNTQLTKLFEVYNLTPKDRHELTQIFDLLPMEKRMNFLNNFPQHAQILRHIYENIKIERELLLWEAVIDIQQTIEKVKQKQI